MYNNLAVSKRLNQNTQINQYEFDCEASKLFIPSLDLSPKSDATKSDLMTNNHGYYSKAVLITWLLYTKSETLYTIIQ